MKRRAAIAWLRMCRPGSIQVCEQEDYLLSIEPFPSYSTTKQPRVITAPAVTHSASQQQETVVATAPQYAPLVDTQLMNSAGNLFGSGPLPQSVSTKTVTDVSMTRNYTTNDPNILNSPLPKTVLNVETTEGVIMKDATGDSFKERRQTVGPAIMAPDEVLNRPSFNPSQQTQSVYIQPSTNPQSLSRSAQNIIPGQQGMPGQPQTVPQQTYSPNPLQYGLGNVPKALTQTTTYAQFSNVPGQQPQGGTQSSVNIHGAGALGEPGSRRIDGNASHLPRSGSVQLPVPNNTTQNVLSAPSPLQGYPPNTISNIQQQGTYTTYQPQAQPQGQHQSLSQQIMSNYNPQPQQQQYQQQQQPPMSYGYGVQQNAPQQTYQSNYLPQRDGNFTNVARVQPTQSLQNISYPNSYTNAGIGYATPGHSQPQNNQFQQRNLIPQHMLGSSFTQAPQNINSFNTLPFNGTLAQPAPQIPQRSLSVGVSRHNQLYGTDYTNNYNYSPEIDEDPNGLSSKNRKDIKRDPLLSKNRLAASVVGRRQNEQEEALQQTSMPYTARQSSSFGHVTNIGQDIYLAARGVQTRSARPSEVGEVGQGKIDII